MIVRDWRDVAARVIHAGYQREREYWRDVLSWETDGTWEAIEQARVTWGLPGTVAMDADEQVLGWAFHVIDRGVAMLGGLVSSSAPVTAALLDAVHVRSPDAIEMTTVFVPDRAPGLASALAERGFVVESYHYLSAPLPLVVPAHRPIGTSWREDDTARAALLLERAYPGDLGAQFAPHGEIEDWLRYVANLVEQIGCGVFDASATRVVREGEQLRGLALMTRVDTTTAHLAQLAIDPTWRRMGVAARLTMDAASRAADEGMRRLTLLVAEGNVAGQALYRSIGFTHVASFIAARRRAWPDHAHTQVQVQAQTTVTSPAAISAT